jgi:predicted dehydrogenase
MKIATIGTGFIVDSFLNAIQSIPGAKCISMASRKRETAMPLAQKYGIPIIYTDLDEMLSNSEVDFVYVASPNSLHYEQAVKALEHGKNVICEKPFTSTSKETGHLISLARQHHLMLFEAITNIHLPNYSLIKENLPRLGKIRMIQCNYSQYSSRYDKLKDGGNPNIFNPDFSGGALVDLNIYNIHFIMKMFGPPQKVKYYANKYANGIDTSGILILEYADFLAECVACKDTNSMNFALIQGENGYLLAENGANRCQKGILCLPSERIVLNQQPKRNLLYYELKQFRDIFTQQDFSKCHDLLDHSYSVMKVVEAARKSAGIVFSADLKGF